MLLPVFYHLPFQWIHTFLCLLWYHHIIMLNVFGCFCIVPCTIFRFAGSILRSFSYGNVAEYWPSLYSVYLVLLCTLAQKTCFFLPVSSSNFSCRSLMTFSWLSVMSSREWNLAGLSVVTSNSSSYLFYLMLNKLFWSRYYKMWA